MRVKRGTLQALRIEQSAACRLRFAKMANGVVRLSVVDWYLTMSDQYCHATLRTHGDVSIEEEDEP